MDERQTQLASVEEHLQQTRFDIFEFKQAYTEIIDVLFMGFISTVLSD